MAQSASRIVKVMTLLMALAAFSAAPAMAQNHQDTPLMVVRFNQPRVHYQQSLHNVLNRALEAKQDVVFNIISLVPQAGNPTVDQKLQAETQARTGSLVGDMVRMGVPQNRLRVTYQKSAVEYPEVHIFVQ